MGCVGGACLRARLGRAAKRTTTTVATSAGRERRLLPRKHHRADRLEQMVWEFVSDCLKNPGRLHTGLERMVEEKRKGLRGDPEREARTWLEKLAEADRIRAGYQELAAKGLMTFEELGARLEELEETRRIARRELETLEGKRAELRDLEHDVTALLSA
jgi:hypothetical protein